jgi:hypothetical protein
MKNIVLEGHATIRRPQLECHLDKLGSFSIARSVNWCHIKYQIAKYYWDDGMSPVVSDFLMSVRQNCDHAQRRLQFQSLFLEVRETLAT